MNLLGQDWDDGKESPAANNTSGPTRKIEIKMDNIAGVDSDVTMEGNDQPFKIPDKAIATIKISTDKDTSTFTAKDSDGKDLMINGQDKTDIKTDGPIPLLVIHKKGK